MPDICIASANPCASGEHLDVTATIDGVQITARLCEQDLIVPLTAEEQVAFFLLTARRLRQRNGGTPLAQFVNRVLHGEEATNVKVYAFFGPGVAITKTNIGTSYVNICPGLNGERQVVDFTGCTQYRLMLHANLVGTGQWGARVVRDSDNAILHESANLGAAGERELDTDWQTLPAAFQGQGLMFLRAQAKSTTPADDPVFRSLRLGVR